MLTLLNLSFSLRSDKYFIEVEKYASFIKPGARIDIKYLPTLSSTISLTDLDEPINRVAVEMGVQVPA
jgi:hypothetical protein